jgi:hypothetical protein
MTNNRIRVLTFSALALVAGCNEVATTQPADATPGAAASSDVAVTVGLANALPQKAAKRFAEVGAEAKIRELAGASLRSTGRWNDGMSITVTVEEFRLRTTGQVAVGGIMSGADRIDAQVAVLKDGQVIKSQKVSAMSRQGGMVGAKESKRLEGLVTTFADNMAQLI